MLLKLINDSSPVIMFTVLGLLVLIGLYFLVKLIKGSYRRNDVTEHTGKGFTNRDKLSKEEQELIDDYYKSVNNS